MISVHITYIRAVDTSDVMEEEETLFFERNSKKWTFIF